MDGTKGTAREQNLGICSGYGTGMMDGVLPEVSPWDPATLSLVDVPWVWWKYFPGHLLDIPDLSSGLEGIVQGHEIDFHPFSAHPQQSQGWAGHSARCWVKKKSKPFGCVPPLWKVHIRWGPGLSHFNKSRSQGRVGRTKCPFWNEVTTNHWKPYCEASGWPPAVSESTVSQGHCRPPNPPTALHLQGAACSRVPLPVCPSQPFLPPLRQAAAAELPRIWY